MELVETQDLYCTTCDKYKDRAEFKDHNKKKESKLPRTCNSCRDSKKSTRQKKRKSEQLLIEDQDQDVVYEHVEIDSLVESVVYALNEYHDPLNKENTLAFCFGCITDVGLLEMSLKQIADLLIDHIEDADNYKWVYVLYLFFYIIYILFTKLIYVIKL